MNYAIIWDEKAKEFLKKIDKAEAQRIIKKVNSIVEDPKHYLEFLVDIDGFKLRAGDYRVLIGLDENNKTINVLLIGHRKNIYKYLTRLGFRSKR